MTSARPIGAEIVWVACEDLVASLSGDDHHAGIDDVCGSGLSKETPGDTCLGFGARFHLAAGEETQQLWLGSATPALSEDG